MHEPVQYRLRGVISREIGKVSANPVWGYTIGRWAGWIEQILAIEPLQPTAIAIDDPAVGIFGKSGARATFIEHIADHKRGLPPTPVRFGPFLERLTAAFRILMKYPVHRSFSFMRNFENGLIKMTDRRGCLLPGSKAVVVSIER